MLRRRPVARAAVTTAVVVGTAEVKDHLRLEPGLVVMRIGRMWDFFRPEQNIFLNGVLEGRGGDPHGEPRAEAARVGRAGSHADARASRLVRHA